jgi:hypothetical protein
VYLRDCSSQLALASLRQRSALLRLVRYLDLGKPRSGVFRSFVTLISNSHVQSSRPSNSHVQSHKNFPSFITVEVVRLADSGRGTRHLRGLDKPASSSRPLAAVTTTPVGRAPTFGNPSVEDVFERKGLACD